MQCIRKHLVSADSCPDVFGHQCRAYAGTRENRLLARVDPEQLWKIVPPVADCAESKHCQLANDTLMYIIKQLLEDWHSPSHPPKRLVPHCSSFLSLIENPGVPCPALISTGLQAKRPKPASQPNLPNSGQARPKRMDGLLA
jgi:hypothetical protein